MSQLMFATLAALLYHQKSARGLKNRRVIKSLNGQRTISFCRDPVGLKVSALRDLTEILLHKRLQAATVHTRVSDRGSKCAYENEPQALHENQRILLIGQEWDYPQTVIMAIPSLGSGL